MQNTLSNSLDDLLLPNKWQEDDGLDPANTPIAHYTTAETAMKMIKSEEIWLRNVRVMNDYSEIAYGLDLMARAWDSTAGEVFKQVANSCFSGVIDLLDRSLGLAQRTWPYLDHHIACFSIHDSAEDQRGRLSMWRAYGGIALVFRLSEKVAAANANNPLGVHLLKVDYSDSVEAVAILQRAAKAIDQNRNFVQGHRPEEFMQAVTQMICSTAVATKHPGFKEEAEARIYFHPSADPKSALKTNGKIECIKGIPQMIYPLSLRTNSQNGNGLPGVDLQSILDKIIVGPTDQPDVVRKAFVDLLKDAQVPDADRKVVVSNIPLRTCP